jgi:hypothetical protein
LDCDPPTYISPLARSIGMHHYTWPSCNFLFNVLFNHLAFKNIFISTLKLFVWQIHCDIYKVLTVYILCLR